ncbi:MAG: ribosomal RNA small subunit methyltransferase A [Candidatus Zambryskibacteria bacterium]|nr:ribosomal RNA small subunit methyltransferase A [Candidatus Zambryskibacteria bacterium]
MLLNFKKSLGQHFLRSERALNKIVEAGNIKPGETILEIGSGAGALTEKLLATGAKIIAVEKDDQLFELLKNKFGDQLTLIHDDILNFQTSELPAYKLISNIPYNITGAILKKFLSADKKPEKIVLLVQKEVAERTIARDKKESVLSVSVKAYGKPHYIETVKAGSFAPVPKVDSAIISIDNILGNFDEKNFFKVLRVGFSSKRKKLFSNLSNTFAKEKVESSFKKLDLDPNIRAEDLSVENWKNLADCLI